MKKQPQVTEQTKQNLREAFWNLYKQKDLAKISVKEITDLAGYNRGTFYLYYRDVYDLIDQIEHEILDKIEILIQETLPDIVALNLSSLIESVLKLTNPYAPYVKVLLGECGDPGFVTELKHILRPLFVSAFNYDKLPYSDYQKELLLEYYLSGTIGIINRWFQNPQISIDE